MARTGTRLERRSILRVRVNIETELSGTGIVARVADSGYERLCGHCGRRRFRLFEISMSTSPMRSLVLGLRTKQSSIQTTRPEHARKDQNLPLLHVIVNRLPQFFSALDVGAARPQLGALPRSARAAYREESH